MFLHSLLCSSLYQADMHCRKKIFLIYLFSFCEVMLCTGYLRISSMLCSIVGLTKMETVRSCKKWIAVSPCKLFLCIVLYCITPTRAQSKMLYFKMLSLWTSAGRLLKAIIGMKGRSNLHQQMWKKMLVVKCTLSNVKFCILFILVLLIKLE